MGVGGASSLGCLASTSSSERRFGIAEGFAVGFESSPESSTSGLSKARRSIGIRGLFEVTIEAASLSLSLRPTEGRLDERNGELPLRRWDGSTDFGLGADGGLSIDVMK